MFVKAYRKKTLANRKLNKIAFENQLKAVFGMSKHLTKEIECTFD